jgi:predicted ribosomally synthesized peptide with nif11-like leader
MSKQAALTFISRVNSEPSLRDEIQSLIDLSDLIRFADGKGHRFTAADWHEATGTMALSASRELNSKELEEVSAAGVNPQPFYGWGSRFLTPRTVINPCM